MLIQIRFKLAKKSLKLVKLLEVTRTILPCHDLIEVQLSIFTQIDKISIKKKCFFLFIL